MNKQAIDCVLSLKNTFLFSFLCRISGIPVLTYQYNKCILKKKIQQSFIPSCNKQRHVHKTMN